MLSPKPRVLYQRGNAYVIACPLCGQLGTCGANDVGFPDMSSVYYTCDCVVKWHKKNSRNKPTDEDKGQGRFF
jgi:hypothetical protein